MLTVWYLCSVPNLFRLNDDIVKSPSISVFKKRLSGVKFDRFLTVAD